METTTESKSQSQLIESYTIPSESTGWSYKKIFAEYLDGCEAIIIRDPYIRTRQQIRNLADFLTMVGRESRSKVHVHLVTRTAAPDEQKYELISEDNNKKQITNLDFLAKAFSGGWQAKC